MTENEVFEHISNLAGDYKCFDEKISHQESLILCNLIEEIQQYRAIGTVEDIQEVMALCKSLQETVCRYMNIGTVEEFKALKDINRIADNLSKMERIEFKALKEKNIPKKPIPNKPLKEGAYIKWTCPNCGKMRWCGYYQPPLTFDKVCTDCLQAIDWQ